MQVLAAILAALGISATVFRVAWIANLIDKAFRAYRAYQRLPNTIRKQIKIGAVVEIIQEGAQFFEAQVNWVYQGVKEWLEDLFKDTLESLDKEEIAGMVGRSAAKGFNAAMVKKGLPDPSISTFYYANRLDYDNLIVEVGVWLAKIANDKLAQIEGMPTNAKVFSNLADPEAVRVDIDAFVHDQMLDRIGISVGSIFQPEQFAVSVKDGVIDVFTQTMLARWAEYQDEVGGFINEQITVGDFIDMMATATNAMAVGGDGLDFKYYLAIQTRKSRRAIMNRNRQKKYRETHKYVGHWEAKP